MKKFYAVLLAVVATLLVSPAAFAASIKLTLHVERAGEAMWSQSAYSGFTALDAGDNEIELQDEWGWYYLYVKPADGFRLDAIESAQPDSYGSLNVSDPLDYNTFYCETDWDGRVYNIVTTDLAASRTSAVTVAIDGDASKVRARRYGISSDIYFSDAETPIAFDPATELPLTFYASDQPFYSIKLEGEEVAPKSANGTVYEVRPTDGQRIEIQPEWPADIKTTVRINVPEGVEGVVKDLWFGSSSWDKTSVPFSVNEDFEVQAGRFLKLDLNTSDYTVSSVLLNGESQYSTSSVEFFAGAENVTIDVTAAVKQTLWFSINVDKDDAAMYDTSYGYSYKNLKAGDNTIKPEESYWGGYNSVYVKAATGYKITRMYCEAADDEVNVPSDATQSITLYPSDSWLGRTYKLEVVSLDDLRSAKATVTVTDDPSLVEVRTRGGHDIDFSSVTAGVPFEVKFDPTTENNFVFGRRNIPLKAVKLNGEVVNGDTRNSLTRSFTVADGDEIEITAKFDDVEVPVFINVPDNAANVVKRVKVGDSAYPSDEVTFTVGEPLMVKAGNFVALTFDDDKYKINEVLVDGESAGLNTTFFVGEESIDIDVDAAPYGMLNFTLNVTDPSHIIVTAGEYGGDKLELTGTTNALQVSEKIAKIKIDKAAGCYITSIKDENGNPLISSSYYDQVFDITEGMVINVESGQIVNDSEWVMWVESSDNIKTGMNDYGYAYESFWMDEDTRNHNAIGQTGYVVVPFCKALNLGYTMQIYPESAESKLYLNDEEVELNYGYFYKTFYPSHGDVFRLYASTPDKYDVTFELSGDNATALAEGVTVTTDLINDRAEWQNGLNLFQGTQVDLAMPENVSNLKVQLDGADLEAGEDGKYSFVADKAHAVTISSSSAVIEIEGDKVAEDGAVYNMMGVKVLDNATKAELKKLAPGVYIVNGKKQVIR